MKDLKQVKKFNKSNIMNNIKNEFYSWDKPSVKFTEELMESYELITKIKQLFEIDMKSQLKSRHGKKKSNNLKKILIELNKNLKKFNKDWRNEESPF